MIMITDNDIKKLKTVFATKEDLKMYATKEDLKKSASDTVVGLTEFIGEVYEKLSAKIDLILADNKDARNTLDTHERRIERFEEQVYTATSS